MRRKDLRALFAEVLLVAAPTELARRSDGVSVSIEFATIAELRAWLAAAGLPEPYGDPHAWTDNDGKAWMSAHAYPTWHGWKVYASATEPATPLPGPLPSRTADRLSTLAQTTAVA